MALGVRDQLLSRIPALERPKLLRQLKARGVTQAEVYAALEGLHAAAPDGPLDDRILEVSDFVAGFCSPHMKIWDG